MYCFPSNSAHMSFILGLMRSFVLRQAMSYFVARMDPHDRTLCDPD